MRFIYRPLPPIWPSGKRTESYQRRSAPFRSAYTSTMRLLEREIGAIGGKDPVAIEAGFSEAEIRLDGYPRASARPLDPAIIVSFESRYGPLRYGCDMFTWYEANLRAIALALEALRKVDRYGVTKRGEQYKGWIALPESTLSQQEAEAWIRAHSLGAPTLELTSAYRSAAKVLHPDMGGSREDWEKLQRAKTVLGI